jgi:hypothetical protein
MTSTRKLFLMVAGGLAIGIAYYGNGELAAQREQLRELHTQAATQEAHMLALRQTRDEAMRRLKQATEDLNKLQMEAEKVRTATPSPRDSEMTAWLARVKQLKHHFEQNPAQQIPELRLLTDRDWLGVGQTAEFDRDDQVRKSLAAARDAGKNEFVNRMANALAKYRKASNGELPPSTLALAPYFETPPDTAMLQRYQMMQTGKATNSDLPAIQEISAVDRGYDRRFSIRPSGNISSPNVPAVWDDVAFNKFKQVLEEYGKDPQNPQNQEKMRQAEKEAYQR